ncbi:MAG: AAA family ATPase, partial [Myxococcota bacterium]
NLALKILRTLEPANLYRFKREFRAVSDLSHPNIVSLYELVAAEGRWFFTMEIVRGRTILEYVQKAPDGCVGPSGSGETPGGELPLTPSGERRTIDSGAVVLGDSRWWPGAIDAEALPRVGELCDLDRVRHCFGQLALALIALHRAGLVHRDLKPSNVRVTDSGRVVLMDFGIVARRHELGRGRRLTTTAGTPAYMAPEQATGDAPTAQADWYAFGVMLHLVLSQRLPFEGSRREILVAKVRQQPAPLTAVVAGVPDDLVDLCLGLLARTPENRPKPEQILRVLGAASGASAYRALDIFVGRQGELRALHESYRASVVGQGRAVIVVGKSGMGKSALIKRFLRQVQDGAERPRTGGAVRRAPLILRGRCHARETLPYNAFDGIVDGLSQALSGLPDDALSSLLPDDMAILARLFPVLARLPGACVRPDGPLGLAPSDRDPRQLRDRAAAALHQLLARLGQLRPIILYIDDLQWADRDSLELLVAVAGPSLSMLIVIAMRCKDDYQAVWRALHAVADKVTCRQLALEPLTSSECGALLVRGQGPAYPAADPHAQLWAETGGNPLLLVELLAYLDSASDNDLPRTLDQVVHRRLAHLPQAARMLLEAAAVVGEPAPLRLLVQASGLSPADGQRALTTLYANRCIQIVKPGPEHWLMPYHAQVRDAVLGDLAPDRLRGIHVGVAQYLETWEQATLDALARHWRGAGEHVRARVYFIAAAEAAESQLAFDHAAELCRAALDLSDSSSDTQDMGETRDLLDRLGRALQLAGRSYEAAEIYEQAAQVAAGDRHSSAEERLLPAQLAADNWLRSGHIQRGLERLAEVMSALGAPYARTRLGATVSWLVQRVRLRLRGLDYRSRATDVLSQRELARIDTLYAAATSLGMIDYLRGAAVQNRHTLAALKSGDEHRICRALAIEYTYLGVAGGRRVARADALADAVLDLARRLDDSYLLGIVAMARGITLFYTGRSHQAVAVLSECDALLSGSKRAVEWERVTGRYMLSRAQIAVGDLAGAGHTAERYVEDAERRNDVYARTMFLCIPGTWSLLGQDRPERAGRALDSAVNGWPGDAYYIAHYVQAYGRVLVQLYLGDGAAALAILRTALPKIRKLMVTRLRWIKCEVYTLMARAALHAGDQRAVRRALAVVAQGKMPFTDGMAALLGASLSAGQGRLERARAELSTALERFETAGASHMVAAARVRLGQLDGESVGLVGRALSAAGHRALRNMGVRAPERMMSLLAPELRVSK